MYCRLNQHLQTNNVVATEQYRFRKALSTEHANFSLIDNILMAWNKNIHIGGIFYDLTKAFDCVNHDVLTAGLEHYGIHESTINRFKSYLPNRRQRTKLSINKGQMYYSTWEIVKQGVPQGSVLGPLLFYYIYINVLPMSVKHVSKAILFSDDTSVIVTDKDFDSFRQKTYLALTSLNQWFLYNQLVLNITKTKVIKFTPKTTAHAPLDIYYKDNVIDEVKSTKFLGTLIDNHKNWNNHVEHILPKLSAACFSKKEFNSPFKSGYFAYGLLSKLSFSTSLRNNLMRKFNTCASSI